MNETLFYVLGIGLVVLALVVTGIGLRWTNFPTSRGLLVGVALVFACLVGATATFAWLNAEDEQEHREAELAEASEEDVAEGDVGEAEEEVGPEAAEEEAPDAAAAAEGAAVFESAGCGGCHTLAAAGSSGTTGPDLDGALAGKDTAYIEEAIVDPEAEIAPGFPPGVMPSTFGEDLSPEELDALVAYLSESTGGNG